MMDAAYAIDQCELARGEEPKLLRLMPVERYGFAVNRKNGSSVLRLGFVGGGTLDFELPKGAAEKLIDEMQQALKST